MHWGEILLAGISSAALLPVWMLINWLGRKTDRWKEERRLRKIEEDLSRSKADEECFIRAMEERKAGRPTEASRPMT